MEKEEIKRRTQNGRDFMKDSVDDPSFKSDQDLKLPQPPLTKAAMTDTAFRLPTDFSTLQIDKDFTTIINTRKSSRVYTQMPITLTQLSYLLWVTQGIKEIRGKSYATLRTVPSGGARHPFETYLIVKHVEGLKPGKYHYLPMHHELEFLGPVEDMDTTISTSLCEQAWLPKPPSSFIGLLSLTAVNGVMASMPIDQY